MRRTFTIHLKSDDEYKTVADILRRHNLRPVMESWAPYDGNRHITFRFATEDEAAIAIAALSDFMPP